MLRPSVHKLSFDCLVYVAGALTKGSETVNVRKAVIEARKLWDEGFTPFVPHLSVFWNLVLEDAHDYEAWMDYDFSVIKKCDALVRITGESPGADREVEFAKQNGIPVYYGVQDIIDRWPFRSNHDDNA